MRPVFATFNSPPHVDPCPEEPGRGWQLPGTVNRHRSHVLNQAVLAATGILGFAPPSVQFYFDVDPASDFLARAKDDGLPFHIAVRAVGAAWVVSEGPARIVSQARQRPPVPYPARRNPPTIVAVSIDAADGPMFRVVHAGADES